MPFSDGRHSYPNRLTAIRPEATEGDLGETRPSLPPTTEPTKAADAEDVDQPGGRSSAAHDSPPKPALTNAAAESLPKRHQQLAAGSATQWMFRGTTLEEDLQAFADAGLDGISLNHLKIEECGRKRTVDLVRRSGLRVTSLDWITNFTGYNGCPLDESKAEAVRMIRLAERLGAANVTVLTGPKHSHTRRHSETLVVESLRWLADVAEASGVDLALMPMKSCCAADWTFLHTIPHTMELLERIDSPRVGMLFHTVHLYDQQGLPAQLNDPAVTDRIKLVRISDWERDCRHENDQRFPGEGAVPLAGLLGSLQRAGFDGYHEVDVWSARAWQTDSESLLQDCRAFCESHIPAPNPPSASDVSPSSGVGATFEAVLRPA